MKNAKTKLFDYITAHSINLEKVKLATISDIIKIQRRIRDDCIAELAKIDPTSPLRESFKVKRKEALIKQADKIITAGYDDIDKTVAADLREIGGVEANFALNSINRVVGVDIATVSLSGNQLSAIANKTLIRGAVSSKWWKRTALTQKNSFVDAIQMAMARGDSMSDIVRVLRGTREMGFNDGVFQMSTRNAEAIARTAIQTVANAARQAAYAENLDVIDAEIWLSTLDGRTTLICIARDGKRYTIPDHEPIGHDLPWLEGPGAIHFNCRSTSLPDVSDFETIPKAKQREVEEAGKRSSMNGPIAGDTTYIPWLKAQPRAFQDLVLGSNKAALWRQGKLDFRDLLNGDGKPLPIKALKRKYEDEWGEAFD